MFLAFTTTLLPYASEPMLSSRCNGRAAPVFPQCLFCVRNDVYQLLFVPRGRNLADNLL